MFIEIKLTDSDDRTANVILHYRKEGFSWRAVSPQTVGDAGAGSWDWVRHELLHLMSERLEKPDGDRKDRVVLQLTANEYNFKVGDTGSGIHFAEGRRLGRGPVNWECVTVR